MDSSVYQLSIGGNEFLLCRDHHPKSTAAADSILTALAEKEDRDTTTQLDNRY